MSDIDDVKAIVNVILSKYYPDSPDIPKRVGKRKRRRLANSLKKKVQSMSTDSTREEIISKLGTDVSLKYQHQHKKTPGRKVIYHDDVDLYFSESSDESESEKSDSARSNLSSSNFGEPQLPRTKYCNLQSTRDQNVGVGHPEQYEIPYPKKGEKLNSKMSTSKSAYEEDKSKTLCNRLLHKNRLLNLRSKELTKIKLAPYLSQRTLKIAESACFSEFFGHVDEVLLETPVSMCMGLPQTEITKVEMFGVTQYHEICRATVVNGEFVVLKKLKNSLKFAVSKCFTLLAYEAKILKLVGDHENILKCYGISVVNQIPALVLSFESCLNLKQFLSRNRNLRLETVKNIITGVGKGIDHIHDAGILHNMLLPENICLKYSTSNYAPVIVGFSSSCRVNSSKSLTILQQRKVADTNHLPEPVKNGRNPPSKRSDIFSFGRISQHLSVRSIPSTPESLDIFYIKCLDQDRNVTADFYGYLIDCITTMQD